MFALSILAAGANPGLPGQAQGKAMSADSSDPELPQAAKIIAITITNAKFLVIVLS
jgi:hypothetical protein